MKNILGIFTLFLLMETAFPSGPASAKAIHSLTRKSKSLPLQYVIQDLQGGVLIRDKKTGKTERAQEEETVAAGDEVLTQSGAKASLTLNQNTMFRLSENSDIKVEALARRPKGTGFISRLGLLAGKILSEVEDLRKSQSSFEVSSGGVICGVRGTAFEVEKVGKTLQTKTFHGVVEVKKGALQKTVVADQNQGFAFDQDTFLPKRTLTQEERKTYQTWLTQKAVVERKLMERQAVLNSISQLSEEEQADLTRKLEAYPEKDRLKKTREMLQDWSRDIRKKTLEKIKNDAAQKREENDSLRDK